MTRVAFCNNMVTPYTNRLFNYIATIGTVDIHVVSCSVREKNRKWADNYDKKYDHIVLKGIEIPLGGARFAHVNFGVWRALTRLKPEVVSINGLYPTMLIAAFWSLVHRVPFMFETDGWRLVMPQSIFHRLVRWFIFKTCQACMSASEKGRRYFVEEGVSPDRIFVTHIPTAWDAPDKLPDFNQRPYHLLWCGRLDDPTKNPKFFVEFAELLKKRIANLRIRIIGDGSLRQQTLDDLSKAGVNFDHVAYIPPTEIVSAFTSARVLVLPSTQEPWGLVCNEAMQCGTPCIVSPFTGVADQLVVNEQSGWVRNLDAKQWTDVLAMATTDREMWTAMSKAAIRTVAQYDLKSSGDRWIESFVFASRR